MTEQVKKMALIAAAALDDRKAEDIQILDISDMTVLADGFVLASASNVILVRALCDEVEQAMQGQGFAARRIEGYQAGRWVVLDFSDILVHILHKEEREFYNLERLWSNGNNIESFPDVKG